MIRHIGGRWSVIGIVLATMLASTNALPAFASEVHRFDIPAQKASEAIDDFASQAHVQILVAGEKVKDKQLRALSGEYSTQEGLTLLLADSGLSPKYVGERSIALVSASTEASSVTTDKGATTTQKPEAEAKKSFWDRIRISRADGASESERLPESTAAADSKVEEIVVTAQKRKERLVDTPVSVSVLSGKVLQEQGATQFRDFANTIPGLSFTTRGAGETSITLRGVTTGIENGPTVGVYIDEVPFGSSSAFANGALIALDVGLFDVDRVEVLRGPQGTLYGASTMGGLIRYVSRAPSTTDFKGNLELGIAATRQGGAGYQADGAINVPLASGRSALRASGFYSKSGGFIDNVATGESEVDAADVYGGRLDWLAQPTDDLSIRLSAFTQNISRDGTSTADFGLDDGRAISGLEQLRNAPERFAQRFRLVSATLEYAFGAATLTSVSSYQKGHTEFALDRSAVLVPVLATFFDLHYGGAGVVSVPTTDKFTQEVRLASSDDARFQWLVGGFYTDEDTAQTQDIVPIEPDGERSSDNVFHLEVPSRYRELAAFADLTYRFTDRLDATVGARVARNRQRFEQIGSGSLGTSSPARSASENVTTYLTNLRYHLTPNQTTYLRFATGYRPGGPNFVADDPDTGEPLGPPTFEADKLNSYEIGYKVDSGDRRFSAELAAYFIDWDNIQISAQRNGFGVIDNAPGGATIRGGEITFLSHPLDPLTISGSVGYQDAQMSKADVDLGAAKHERLPNIPHVMATLGFDYRLPGLPLSPSVGGLVRHVSERTATFNNNVALPQYRFPDYTSVDLRGSLRFGRVDTQLYLNNIFDERGQLSAFLPAAGAGRVPVAVLMPRTIGIRLVTEF